MAVTVGVFIAISALLISMSDGPGKIKEQEFRARPGTQRSSAQALVSTARSGAPVSNVPKAEQPSFDPEAAVTLQSSETERAVRESRLALTPEASLERLQLALTLDAATGAAQIYGAMAEAYLRLETPNLEAARDAVAAGKGAALSPADYHACAKAEAELLLSSEDVTGAADVVATALEKDATVSVSRLELLMLLGRLREQEKDPAAAEGAYRAAMGEAFDTAAGLGPQGEHYYRQAGIRLARLLRATGREKEADALARTVQNRLQ